MYPYYPEVKTSMKKARSSFSFFDFDNFNSTSFKIPKILPSGSLETILKSSIFIKQ